MKLAIVGYGELGKQLETLAKEIFDISRLVVFDDIAFNNRYNNAFAFQDFMSPQFGDYHFLVALGYKHLSKKKEIINSLKSNNRLLPSLVHPSCYVSSLAKLEDAVYLYPMCNIDKNVIIQSGTLLNNSVTISHDNQIGQCCYISPGVTTSGNVSIGDCSFIGTGTIISNNISIGKNTITGIGTVVTQSIPNNYSAVGNPIKIFNKKLRLL